MKLRPLHICIEVGLQEKNSDVFDNTPASQKRKSPEKRFVSRGFCSRADWIRTSDLYTPSVARYQTTLQPVEIVITPKVYFLFVDCTTIGQTTLGHNFSESSEI